MILIPMGKNAVPAFYRYVCRRAGASAWLSWIAALDQEHGRAVIPGGRGRFVLLCGEGRECCLFERSRAVACRGAFRVR